MDVHPNLAAPVRDEVSRRSVLRGSALGAAALGGAVLLGGCGAVPKPVPAGTPQKRGGTYYHAVTGGGLDDTIDAHFPVATPDIARVNNLYEPLLKFDFDFKVQPNLATAVEPNADATVWTVRLRKGVMFHHGKEMTADDVVFSLQRILDPKNPAPVASELSMLLPQNVRKVDDYTVELTLESAYAEIDQLLAGYGGGIVPTDYDPKSNPVGTGPFKVQSFTPGRQSVFLRFDDYWDQPAWVDELVIIDFADNVASVNALLARQVHSADNIPPYLARGLESQGISALVSKGGTWTPFTMRVDNGVYADPDVRNALRWVPDRQQIIDQALSGYGSVANDLYAPFDAGYIGDQLPQRDHDPERVRFLLKKAGQPNLQVELVTSDAVGADGPASAKVFVEQAKACGISVNLRVTDSSVFYGGQYLKWPFAMDFWNTRNYLAQVAQCALAKSPYNETHFDNAEFTKLYMQARAELDESKRRELIGECQKIEYDEGGYIIPYFKQSVDAYSNLVQGFRPSKVLPMGQYKFQYVSLVRQP